MNIITDRRTLLNLILEVSFEQREVTLASGKKSDFYLDLRQTLMRPIGVGLAGSLVFEQLRSFPLVAAVGGMAVGAVPLVAAVLAAANNSGAIHLRGFFVRKEKKEHGLGKQIEGGFEAGQKVAFLEDTMTTGGSTLQALDIVEAAGGNVVRVICLVDRCEGAREAFAERGIKLESIFTREDLPNVKKA